MGINVALAKWAEFGVGSTVVVAQPVRQYGDVVLASGTTATVVDRVNAGFRGMEYTVWQDGRRVSGVPASALQALAKVDGSDLTRVDGGYCTEQSDLGWPVGFDLPLGVEVDFGDGRKVVGVAVMVDGHQIRYRLVDGERLVVFND